MIKKIFIQKKFHINTMNEEIKLNAPYMSTLMNVERF